VLQVSHAFNGGVINLLRSGETLIMVRHEAAYMEQTLQLTFASEAKIHTILITCINILWKDQPCGLAVRVSDY
jgi:UDP-N-acetylglucosamine transferase subunit ALG13